MRSAKNALSRARRIVCVESGNGKVVKKYAEGFKLAVENDLNSPGALAVFWTMLRDGKLFAKDKKATALDMDRVLGFDLDKVFEVEIPEEVQGMIDERQQARVEKDFELADQLRDQIEKRGYTVEDSEKTVKVLKK